MFLATHVCQSTLPLSSALMSPGVSGAAHLAVHGIVPLCITGPASADDEAHVCLPDHIRITI